jgi:hypothetical protein
VAYLHQRLVVLGHAGVTLQAVGVGPTSSGANFAKDHKVTFTATILRP